MSDDWLRAAYEQMLATRPARGTCPTPDALAAALRHEGSEDERLSVLDHAASCTACLRDLELLRSIDAAERRELPARGAVVGGFRWRRVVTFALAASLVLAFALGPGRHLLHGPDDVGRGAAATVTVVRPDDGAAVPSAPIELAWRRVPDARSYVAEVAASDGTLAARIATRDTTALLRAALVPGEYRWWVRAQMVDGSERRSAARLLRVRAP